MKEALQLFNLISATFIALVVQYFLAPVDVLYGARVMLVPIIFCYGALSLPFPWMLALALFTGFVSDLAQMQVTGAHVEMPLGWSIAFYGIIGAVAQGVRREFLRGSWWLQPVMSGVAVWLMLLAQFGMISLRRLESGGLYWSEVVGWRILNAGILAILLAPLLYLVIFYWERLLGLDRKAVRTRK